MLKDYSRLRLSVAEDNGDFVRIPAVVNPVPASGSATVRVELTSSAGELVLYWPIGKPQARSHWLKALA